MNLRILKKLSKRAAPLLPLLGDCRDQFPAVRGENHTGQWGHDRKHWERTWSKHATKCRFFPIVLYPKHGKGLVVMREPSTPWKGTLMVGEVPGYYEPEWSEETAWEALERLVWEHFTEWNEDGPTFLRTFRYPSDIFRAAHEIIAARAA
jgi:hypothetical protein